MDNALQIYLKENNAQAMSFDEISELMALKGVSVKGAEGTPYLLFKYSDLAADFYDPVVKCSRGIILDQSKNFEAVCVPFDKFGNYGEDYADDIDWGSARVQEKLDGSIVKLYHSDLLNKWVFSTNGTIFADSANLPDGSTFGDLIKQAKNYGQLMDAVPSLRKDRTYIFELTSPANRIVIGYPETKLTHIGTRENDSKRELQVDIGIEKPTEYPVHTLEDAIEYANKICTPEERHEGFVVVDKYYHRIKVKNSFYLQAHYLMGKLKSAKNIVKVIDAGDAGEILSYMPNMESLKECLRIFDDFKAEVRDYCEIVKENYLDMCPYPLPKEANKCLANVLLNGGQCPFPSVMFKFRDYYEGSERKGSAQGFVNNLTCADAYKVWENKFEEAVEKSMGPIFYYL